MIHTCCLIYSTTLWTRGATGWSCDSSIPPHIQSVSLTGKVKPAAVWRPSVLNFWRSMFPLIFCQTQDHSEVEARPGRGKGQWGTDGQSFLVNHFIERKQCNMVYVTKTYALLSIENEEKQIYNKVFEAPWYCIYGPLGHSFPMPGLVPDCYTGILIYMRTILRPGKTNYFYFTASIHFNYCIYGW